MTDEKNKYKRGRSRKRPRSDESLIEDKPSESKKDEGAHQTKRRTNLRKKRDGFTNDQLRDQLKELGLVKPKSDQTDEEKE